mgnify:CR=1 FL=1
MQASNMEFLVKSGDILDKSLPKPKLKEVALKLSLDMYTVHTEVESRVERLSVLVDYFKKRPGVMDEDAKKPENMAMKMMLMGDITEVIQGVCEQADCDPDDLRINLEFTDSSDHALEMTVGLHKRLSSGMRKVLSKLIDIHMARAVSRFNREHPGIIMCGMDADEFKALQDEEPELDEDVEKALEKMKWDKTSRGEA